MKRHPVEHLKALKKIKLLLLDVDGVMTDGKIVYGENGYEIKSFDTKDGLGLKMLQKAGVEVGIITGRTAKCVEQRAADLGIEILYQGIDNKLIPFNEILAKCGLTADEVAYMGDDVNDVPILELVGFSATVADAMHDAKDTADFITDRKGGRGAVREVCDKIIEAKRTNVC